MTWTLEPEHLAHLQSFFLQVQSEGPEQLHFAATVVAFRAGAAFAWLQEHVPSRTNA